VIWRWRAKPIEGMPAKVEDVTIAYVIILPETV
jgi:hypothetical protein